MKSEKPSLIYRSEYLLELLNIYVEKDDSILEIGSGDGRNVEFLKANGYTNVTGIDKKSGTPIEAVPRDHYDVIFTMSTLFLIPPENDWVFEKIAGMARKWIITIEGETSAGPLVGRDYSEVFAPFGFYEKHKEEAVFNEFGVCRILKRYE
jgi:hypothetical protein